jgi:hypothetical protein
MTIRLATRALARRVLAYAVLVAALSSLRASASGAVDAITRESLWDFTRAHATTVFDARRSRIFALGGYGRAGDFYVGTAMLDLAHAPFWQRPQFAGIPDPTFVQNLGVAAVYDSLRDRILVFAPHDTLVYSLSLAPPMTWSSFHAAGAFSPHFGAMAAYDPVADRVLLFGGYEPDHYQPAIHQTTADLEILSLSGAPAWSAPLTAGASPPNRAEGVAVWDRRGNRMLVYGGFTQDGFSPTALSDTYQFSFVAGVPTWAPVSPTGTAPARYDVGGLFDSAYQRLLIVGNSGVAVLDAHDPGNWTTGGYSPPVGAAPVAAYDPAGQRAIAASGEFSYRAPVGGTWQASLAGAPGPWSSLPVPGDVSLPVQFAGYDPAAHRFAALVGGAPVFLSVDDSAWSADRVDGPAPATRIGPFYDATTNTMYALSQTDLFTVHPGADTAWTHIALPGPQPPLFDTMAVACLDLAHDRILVIGGARNTLAGTSTTEFWQLDLGASPTWTKLADSTPLGAREARAVEDVRRGRILVFGGQALDAGGSWVLDGDLWALDLATLTWSAPSPAGLPPSARANFVAVYDSTRDRMIVTGDTGAGTYDLQFGPSDANGTWIRNDPEGPPLPWFPSGMGIVDPARDRMYAASPTGIYTIRFGPYLPRLAVTPPAPKAWTPAAVMPIYVAVSQGVAGAHSYAWTLRSQRDWPGWPLAGGLAFPASGTEFAYANAPVPDSVAAGLDTLTFAIHDVADPSVRDSCVLVIGDQNSPVLWALGQSSAGPDGVTLTWWVAYRSAAQARVERSVDGAAWGFAGNVPIGGDGTVRFTDTAVAPGERIGYRAGVPSADAGGYAWSDVAWVDVPAAGPPRLAFASAGALLVRGALDVAFTVPRAGTARLEAYDLRGRLVAARTIEAAEAGPAGAQLAAAGALRSGVYFLRLTQGGARVERRALVLPGP